MFQSDLAQVRVLAQVQELPLQNVGMAVFGTVLSASPADGQTIGMVCNAMVFSLLFVRWAPGTEEFAHDKHKVLFTFTYNFTNIITKMADFEGGSRPDRFKIDFDDVASFGRGTSAK